MANLQENGLVDAAGSIATPITSIQDSLTKIPENNFHTRFQAWHHRTVFYKDMPDYESLANWLISNKLSYQLKKLNRAVEVSAILQELKQAVNTEQSKIVDEMLEVTNRFIDSELKKIEIVQLRKIEKIQGIHREELGKLQIELMHLKELNKVAVKKIKEPYSLQVNYLITLPPLNKDSSTNNLSKVEKFFKNEENKIHFSKHLSRSDKVSDVTNASKQGIDYYAMLGSLFPNSITLSSSFKAFFQSIPAISLVINSIPHMISLVKGIRQKKSAKKIIGPIVVIGISVAAVAIATFVPITGIIIAATCLMASLSLALGAGIPVWQVSSLRKSKIKEVSELTHREFEREQDSKGHTNHFSALSSVEKQFLVMKLEQLCISDPKISSSLTAAAKDVISSGDFNAVANNDLIKKIVPQHSTHEKNLSALLKTSNLLAKDQVNKEITVLNKEATNRRIGLINGIISWVAIGLVCIPTPVTVILGASILVATSVVSLSMKYGWHTKIKNAIGKIFGNKSEKAVEKTENHINAELQLGLKQAQESTAENKPMAETYRVIREKMAASKQAAPVATSKPSASPLPLAKDGEEHPSSKIDKKFAAALEHPSNFSSRMTPRRP